MNRSIPVWLLLLLLLLSGIFSVIFASIVRDASIDREQNDTISALAIKIAEFPSKTQSVLSNTWTDIFNPWTFIYGTPPDDMKMENFSRIKGSDEFSLDKIIIKSNDAEITKKYRGWRVLIGVYSVDGKPAHQALLLSPELKVMHRWWLTEEKIDKLTPRNPNRKFIHGFAYLPDGSIIFTFDEGTSIQRIDLCGDRIWGTEGFFHHSVNLTNDNASVWALLSEDFVNIDAETGIINKFISLQKIIEANPDIDPLRILYREHKKGGTRFNRLNKKNTSEVWLEDPFHTNDIEPLSTELAASFPMFEAGDLLLSLRNLNLIMVVNPDSLKIKWWRVGAGRRQHDPDWQDGYISFLDNRMSEDSSRITRITPQTYEQEVLFDGRNNDFYTRIRGKHQLTKAGNILITSTQQGRFFEVDKNNNTILEIFSLHPDANKNKTLYISEALFIPEDQFELTEEDFSSCKTLH